MCVLQRSGLAFDPLISTSNLDLILDLDLAYIYIGNRFDQFLFEQ